MLARRHAISAGLLAAVVGALAVTPNAAQAQGAAAAATTAITFRSPTSHPVAVSSATATGAPTPWTNGFYLDLTEAGGHSAGVILTGPPTGLAVGSFALVPEHQTPQAGQASVRLTSDHLSGDLNSGTLTVHEVVKDPGGTITALAADVTGMRAFDQTTAQIRYQSARPWSGIDLSSSEPMPATKVAHPSAPQSLTLRVRGTGAVTFGTATLVPSRNRDDGTENFEILSDGCTGVTVQPDQSCTVTVRGIPDAAAWTHASVRVPDSTAVGASVVDLAVLGLEDAAGTYYPVGQSRILDTRSGNGAPKAAVGAGKEVSLQVAGRGYVPAGTSAVVMNLTAVAPTARTYLTAYPSGTARPTTSSLNTVAGRTRANLVTLPLGKDGKVRIFNASGSTHMLADVLGFYMSDNSMLPHRGMGQQFELFNPTRLFDSRSDGGALWPGERVTMSADFGTDELNAPVRGLALNVTVLGATRPGYTRVFGGTPPNASTVNFVQGQTVPNMTITDVVFGSEGVPEFTVTNESSGSTHILVDAVGVYTSGLPGGLRYQPLAPTRVIDTRSGIGTTATPLGQAEARLFTAPVSVAGDDTWALVANTTAVAPTAGTYLTVWAEENGAVRPGASNVNAAKGETAANATITPMGPGNRFRIFNAAGSTNTLMDVAGSFEIYPSYAVWDGAAAAALTGGRAQAGAAAQGDAGDREVGASREGYSRPAPGPVHR